MPRTFGDAIIHQSHFDHAVNVDVPLSIHPHRQMSPQEEAIGKWIAENLVEDGATLQMVSKPILRFVSESSALFLGNRKHSRRSSCSIAQSQRPGNPLGDVCRRCRWSCEKGLRYERQENHSSRSHCWKFLGGNERTLRLRRQQPLHRNAWN